MKSNKENLFLFNLSMDLDNPILATTNLWANEFSKNFENVYIYSTHVGKFDVPQRVKVTELGGGTFPRRIIAIFKLIKAALLIIRLRRSSIVFHHQSPITSVFPGFFFHLAGIKQGLWYSHSSKPMSLVLGTKFVERIFSSTFQSLPISSSKAIFLGHGVDTLSAKLALELNYKHRSNILYIGRISPIKKLEECISALDNIDNRKISFLAIGPVGSQVSYLDQLNRMALEKNISFRREQPINHDLVFEQMSQFSMFFAGMKNSVDKSCLEAAATGCFVITSDKASADLSGMTDFWNKLDGTVGLPKLSEQIRMINNIDSQKVEKLRLEVSSRAIELNSVNKLITRISINLQEI